MLCLISKLQVSDADSPGFAAARQLVQHIVEHFSRARDIPRFCALLTDAAESSPGFSMLEVKGALWSEGCVSDWGRRVRGFLVPNQIEGIIRRFAARCKELCSAILISDTTAQTDIDRSSPKRRKVQAPTSAPSRSGNDPASVKATGFFAMSALVFQHLPAPDSASSTAAAELSRVVTETLEPSLLSSLQAHSAQGTANGNLISARLQLLSAIATFHEDLRLSDPDKIAPLSLSSLHDATAIGNVGSPELKLSLLHAGLSEAERSRSGNSSRQSLANLVLRCLEGKDNVNLAQATCRMLFSRWVPQLQDLFDFTGLVDVADRAINVAANDDALLDRLFCEGRTGESAMFSAALWQTIMQRLRSLASASKEVQDVTVAVLSRLNVTPLPETLRSILVEACVDADLAVSRTKTLEQNLQKLQVALRTLLGFCLAEVEGKQTISSPKSWLKNVPLDSCDDWPAALQVATMSSCIWCARSILTGASEQQDQEVVRSFVARARSTPGAFAKRLVRSTASTLVNRGPVEVKLLQSSDLALDIDLVSPDHSSLLHALDHLQSLSLLRLDAVAGQVATFTDEEHFAFGEDVIRALSTVDASAVPSDLVTAVAFEVLRFGWSFSSIAQVANRSSRLARWSAAVLSLPTSENNSTALRAEVALRVKESLAVEEYETSLASLEDLLNTFLSRPEEAGSEAAATLYALTLFLCNGPEATGKMARASFDRILGTLTALPAQALQTMDSSLLIAVVDLLESICRQKAVLLRVSETMAIISLCTRIIAPSSNAFSAAPSNASSQLYNGIVATITSLVRQRQDILAGMMPSLTAVLCQLIVLIRRLPAGSGASVVAAAHAGVAPAWLDFAHSALGTTEADLVSRLLLSLTAKRAALPALLKQKKTKDTDLSTSAANTTSLARPFAKHAIHVLVTYCRMLNSPFLTTDPEVRKALRPGLFALCDIVGTHERDAAMVNNLGPAEQVLFKDLWSRWEKQRYRGE